MIRLFKRNQQGDPIEWNIRELVAGDLLVQYGKVGNKLHEEIIPVTLKKVNELESRVTAKRKEGYKSIEDIYDNSPTRITTSKNPRRGDGSIYEQDLLSYLHTYLPKYNITSDGFVLPMLAKTLEDNKPFDKYGDMLGQYKINGLRCLISATRSDDMFKTIEFTYTSREGTKWNLKWFDEILIHSLSNDLLELMTEEGVSLDGELYIPGYTVNDINSFVKNPSMPQHKLLQYWCYDIAIENMSAIRRQEYLNSNIYLPIIQYNKELHLSNKKQFVRLPNVVVTNIVHATELRDMYIERGFEGLILRNVNNEYAFGKRNSSMFKYKKKEDGIFKIKDIKEDKRGLPIYILKNDINDELFECTINLPQDKQKEHLKIKDMLIDKEGLVEYRERSGVKQVPFHAKLIKVFI